MKDKTAECSRSNVSNVSSNNTHCNTHCNTYYSTHCNTHCNTVQYTYVMKDKTAGCLLWGGYD